MKANFENALIDYYMGKIIIFILKLTLRVQKETHRTQFSMHKRERGLTLTIINVLHVIRSGLTFNKIYNHKREKERKRERDEYEPFVKLKISFSSSCSYYNVTHYFNYKFMALPFSVCL